MFYLILAMGLLFFGLGFMVTENNASSLLSGYNTLSKEEQEQFPLTEYLKRFKVFHIRFGILFTVLGVAFYMSNAELLGWHMGITPILAYIYFFYQTKDLSMKVASQKNSFKVGIAVLLATLVFVVGMFYWSDRPSSVVLVGDVLRISGPYGIDLPLEKIDSLGISESLPEISTRRHGISTGTVAKGKYRGPEGDYLLLIDKPYEKVLWIGRKSADPVLISLNKLDEEKLLLELKESLEPDAP